MKFPLRNAKPIAEKVVNESSEKETNVLFGDCVPSWSLPNNLTESFPVVQIDCKLWQLGMKRALKELKNRQTTALIILEEGLDLPDVCAYVAKCRKVHPLSHSEKEDQDTEAIKKWIRNPDERKQDLVVSSGVCNGFEAETVIVIGPDLDRFPNLCMRAMVHLIAVKIYVQKDARGGYNSNYVDRGKHYPIWKIIKKVFT